MNNDENEFIASNKIVRYALGTKAADILATLIYKHNYWKSKGKLTHKNGKEGFFISHDDIREETMFSKDIIMKNIKILEDAGLLFAKRQGLTKPNFYALDFKNINQFLRVNSKKYKNYKANIRSKPGVAHSALNLENPTSKNGIFPSHVGEKSETTNNKKTNNKKTNSTIHMNVAEYEEESFIDDGVEESMIDLIDSLKDSCDPQEDEKLVLSLYELLKSIVPAFAKFRPSDKDLEMIREIKSFKIYSYNISSKILRNAKRINNGVKDPKFYSLFVGLRDYNDNVESQY
ncbi:hypothetical protein [Winogradskyella sp. 3972H.M.0a.05]|uniref:hypothetical protein n=1 Tax=Winogradskyella sp. 3972H.M.0a.05 TaxID=2950277 RepID=UPI0033991201